MNVKINFLIKNGGSIQISGANETLQNSSMTDQRITTTLSLFVSADFPSRKGLLVRWRERGKS